MGKMGLNWVNCRFPWIHRKFCPLIFSQFGLYLKVYISNMAPKSEKGAKMLLANPIAGFLSQQDL